MKSLLWALGLVLAGACATPPARPPRVLPVERLGPLKISARPGPAGTEVQAYDAGELFEQAGRELRARRHEEAAAGYERLLGEFPGSPYGTAALYNLGLAYEALHRHADAARRYQQLLDLAGLPPRDRLDARFRLGACLVELQRFPEALSLYQQILDLSRALTPADHLEALVRRGQVELELSSYEAAERSLRAALALQLARTPETEDALALAYFTLAAIPHRQFQALPLRASQKELEQDLEHKAQLLLLAQGRYIETLRRENPLWSPAAGYQIGRLYQELYELLLNAPMPPELDTEEKQQVYKDVLRERLRSLLTRARRVHERNLAMAGRLGAEGDWARRSGEQLAELQRLLDQANQANQAPATAGTGRP